MTSILFVRHGEAVDADAAGGDSTRWLTAAGRRGVERVGAALRDAGVGCGRVYSSPLVRAVQTAEVLAHALAYDGEVEAQRALSSGTTADVVRMLAGGGGGTLVLVGHEPSIRVAASYLAGLALPAFRTGGACLVEWDGVRGRFGFWLHPHSLERIDSPADLHA